ncbi:porin family protein [Vibrio kasasachensis]|uniref:porin family protein n=1 Tax=Vibrio kasasachensis TaxID=2910248 RepID=UPI003D0A0832
MKIHHILTSTILYLVASTFAHAQESQPNGQWYFQGSIGYSVIDLDDMLDSDHYGIEDSDTSYELALGYLFTEHVGIKFGYRELGEGQFIQDDTPDKLFVQKLDSLFIAMTGHYPISDQFELLGAIGFSKISQDLQVTRLDSSGSASFSYDFTEPYFSLGIEYKFNNTLSILSEFIHQPIPNLVEGNTYQIGLKYKF